MVCKKHEISNMYMDGGRGRMGCEYNDDDSSTMMNTFASLYM